MKFGSGTKTMGLILGKVLKSLLASKLHNYETHVTRTLVRWRQRAIFLNHNWLLKLTYQFFFRSLCFGTVLSLNVFVRFSAHLSEPAWSSHVAWPTADYGLFQTELYSGSLLHCTVQCSTVLFLLYCTVLYSRVQYCTVVYSTELYYCAVLYCTVMFCTLLYSSVLF